MFNKARVAQFICTAITSIFSHFRKGWTSDSKMIYLLLKIITFSISDNIASNFTVSHEIGKLDFEL